MPVSMIANSSAQLAQSAIRVRSDAMTASSQRLSSGLRVTNAGDDPAAQSVGTSLKITNAGLKTAILNAGSAVSALQIADGAMGQMSGLMIRMQSLATQAASGQMQSNSRQMIDTEFQLLKSEIGRLAQTTEFNGVKLLAGTRNFTLTAGSTLANDGIAAVRCDPDVVTNDRVFNYSYNSATEVLTASRVDAGVATSQSIDVTALLDAVAGAGQNIASGASLDVSFSQIGLTLTLNSGFVRGADITPACNVTAAPDMTVVTPTFARASTNVPLTAVAGLTALASGYSATTGNLTVPLTTDGTLVQLGGLAGVSYAVNGGAVGASGAASADLVGAGPTTVDVYVDLPAGGTARVGTLTTGAVTTTGVTAGNVVLGVGKGVIAADYVDDNANTRLTYKVGMGVVSGQDLVNVDVPAMSLTALALTNENVTDTIAANSAISVISAALGVLNQGRATVGAQQLRLQDISSNLSVVTENNESARSALLDADVSKEISDLTANQALIEAGVAMLARANQLPQILLQLIRN